MTPTPKRHLFRFGEPWGLFDKTNPAATRRSVIIHAIVYTMLGAILWLAGKYWRFPEAQYWTIIPTALALGFLGGLIEWQIDDADDDSQPPAAPLS